MGVSFVYHGTDSHRSPKSALSTYHYWLTIDITYIGWLDNALLGKQAQHGGTTFP